MSEIVATIGSHDCDATTKWLGCGGEDLGSSWTMLDWNIVAIKLAGRYNVATKVNAFMAFESLSLSSLRRVRILASEFKVPKVWNMAVLVSCICLLVRKSRILYSYQARGSVSRNHCGTQMKDLEVINKGSDLPGQRIDTLAPLIFT